MRGRAVERIEAAIDATAATLFAAAIGFTAAALLRGLLGHLQREIAAAAAFGGAYFVSLRALRKVAATQASLALADFAVAPFEAAEPDELLLTDADRLQPAGSPARDEPLVLDDILSRIDPGARVVRLFDPSAMPTPGQLRARIDRHLDEGAPQDDSQALFEALAQLRRSLA